MDDFKVSYDASGAIVMDVYAKDVLIKLHHDGAARIVRVRSGRSLPMTLVNEDLIVPRFADAPEDVSSHPATSPVVKSNAFTGAAKRASPATDDYISEVEDEEEVDELDDDTISNTDSRTSVGKVRSSASIDLSKAATRTPSPFPPAKTTPAKSTPGSAHSSLLPPPPPAWHWSSPESKLRRIHLVAEIEEKKKRRNQELKAIELAKRRKLAEAGRNMRLRALKDIEDRKAASADRAASTPPRISGGVTSPLAAMWASSPVQTSAKHGERSKVMVKMKSLSPPKVVDVFCAKDLDQDSDDSDDSEDSDDHDMAVDSDSDEEEADDEGGRDGRISSTAKKGDSRPVKSMSKKKGATKGKAKAQARSSKSKSKSKSGSHRSKRERRNF